jgi:hypothetical protein
MSLITDLHKAIKLAMLRQSNKHDNPQAAIIAISEDIGNAIAVYVAATTTIGGGGGGIGDMLKAQYDVDADGLVNDSAKLGGQVPGYYAIASAVATAISNEITARTNADAALQTNITTAQNSSEAYADGLFATITGTPTPAVAFDTLAEIAAELVANNASEALILTALGYRVRFDINNQGLSALEKANAKANIGVEDLPNQTGNAGKALVTNGTTAAWQTVAGGGGATISQVEVMLAASATRSGTFTITGLSGLTTGNPIMVMQAAGPYTGKGTLDDEAGMDAVSVTGYAVDATTIKCMWQSAHAVIGNFKFNYIK